MPKKSPYEDDYYYDDEEYEDHKGPRKFKKDEDHIERRKKWDRESLHDLDNDYDERR